MKIEQEIEDKLEDFDIIQAVVEMYEDMEVGSSESRQHLATFTINGRRVELHLLMTDWQEDFLMELK